jgi:hypothetical protein
MGIVIPASADGKTGLGFIVCDGEYVIKGITDFIIISLTAVLHRSKVLYKY